VIWYIVWSTMLLISAANTLLYRPFSGNLGFAFSLLLAVVAALQLLSGVRFLSRKEAVLAVALLTLFSTEQLKDWITTLELPSLYSGFDFSAYYLAAKVVSERPRQDLYALPLYPDGRINLNASAALSTAWQTAAIRYHIPFAAPFIYPPFFAVLMKPFAYLSFDSAYGAWKTLTASLLCAAVLFSMKAGGIHPGPKLALMLGTGVFSYFPVGDSLFMGQVDCLILFLLAAGVWLLKKNQTSFSALSFAMATLIKLTPVLAVPVLVFHRRYKWLAAYAAWLCALLVFSLYQAGWTAHRRFWQVALPSTSCGAPVCQNSSLVAYVQELFMGYVPNWGKPPRVIPLHACSVSRLVGFSAYALFLGYFYYRRHQGKLIRDLVVVTLLELAVSPISWWHHYTIALLPFLYLWCEARDKGVRTLTILFLLVGTNIVGYSLLLTENHLAQLMLAAIVPGLTLTLVYLALVPVREPGANPIGSQDHQ
jgi:alpha-1,2-mannosyltransferase